MRFLGLPAFVTGLILVLAGSTWFTGAAAVGWILLVVGASVIAFKLAVLAVALWAASSK